MAPAFPGKSLFPGWGGCAPHHSPQVRGRAVSVVGGGTLECLCDPSSLLAGSRPDTVTLRSAKSEESLSSQASGAGELGVAWPVVGWSLQMLYFKFGGLGGFLVFNLDIGYDELDKASPLVHDTL